MMRVANIRFFLLLILSLVMSCSWAVPLSVKGAIQLYSQDELLTLIRKNQHLQRVKTDECQLNQDIMAHSIKLKEPAYQFLYGDMLLYGVCIERDVVAGMRFIGEAADQGFPEALEQLGRYYRQGRFVQKDPQRALPYLRSAASLGHINAQLSLVELYLQGVGNPADYEMAYHWLYNAIIAEPAKQKKASRLLTRLANQMPAHIVARARKPLER